MSSNSETSAVICWTTAKEKDSILYWGTTGIKNSQLDKMITSPKATFHTATIKNLFPETTYFYSIDENFSLYPEKNIFSFTTFSAKNSNKEIEFIIAGDFQPKNKYTLKTNRIMAEQINREKPDFIVQTGDMVQIGSSKKTWHNFMKSLPIMSSERPFLPAIGNHEYYIFHKNKNFRSFFPYPFKSKKGCYYSKDTGSVHVVFLDPYDGGFAGMNSKIGKAQKIWLISDLDNALKRNMKWFFIVLHQPPLTCGEYPVDIKLRNWLIPIASRYKIDAVFFGHAHLYEHWSYTYGANGFLLNPKDTPGDSPVEYFCIGSSGASLESNYHLFSHRPYRFNNSKWFNTKTEQTEKINEMQNPWNKNIFFKRESISNRFEQLDLHFYQNPDLSYTSNKNWFGYKYGENTLHYAKVKIEKNICTISIHYPDGSLLQGPEGTIPQSFVLNKKNR